MKIAVTVLIAIAALPAQADMLVAKGTNATLTAEYEYIHAGKSGTKAGGGTNEWNAKRSVVVTAQMSADAPQPFGAMHKTGTSQETDMRNKSARAASAQEKMAPLMADMEKVARDCGDDLRIQWKLNDLPMWLASARRSLPLPAA